MVTIRFCNRKTSCSALSTYADTCRSGEAASEGSKVGFQREADAANAQADSSKTSSDTIGKCVSSITQIKITVPTFPSLDDIFKKVEDKVCQMASDEISGVTGDIDGQIDDIMNQINGDVDIYTDPNHYVSSTYTQQPTVQSTASGTTSTEPNTESSLQESSLTSAYR